MTKKDLNANESAEKDKKSKEDWESHHTTEKRYPEEAKGIGEPDIKNAHASGDGSFGRNESSIPDEGEKDNSEGNAY